MSSYDLISSAVGTRLHVWVPQRPGDHSRVIYVEDALFQEIENGSEFRIGALWQDFDRFSLGGLITVGYGPEPTCMLKQLDPKGDEIWEMRSRDPDPQIRVFGRFCERDEFVATHAVYRDILGDPWKTKFEGNTWPQEILRCRIVWNQICQGAQCYQGANINDYISKNVLEISKLP